MKRCCTHKCLLVLVSVLASCTGEIAVPGENPDALRWFPGKESTAGPTALWRISPVQYRRVLASALGQSVAIEGFDDPIRVLTLPNHTGHEIETVFLESLEEQVHRLVDQRAAHLVSQLPCNASSIDRTCVGEFLDGFVPPIQRTTQFNRDGYLKVFDDVTRVTSPRDGFMAAVAAVLLSPKTLYRTELGSHSDSASGKVMLSPDELAETLALTLWNDVPDAELLAAAASNDLSDQRKYREQVDRLLSDSRAERGIQELVSAWAGILGLETFPKDTISFPDWSKELAQSMLAETAKYLEHWVKNEDATFDVLFTSSESFPDDRMAAFYGMAPPAAGTATLMPPERRGLFTHASVLSALSAPTNTALVFRGRWLLSRVFCAPLERPDDSMLSLEDLLRDAPPDATLRTQLETIEEAEGCGNCHRAIHPPGFALEQYDGIGKFRRTDERGRTIDTASTFSGTRATDGSFTDVPSMLALLSESPEIHACFVRQAFRYAVGRDETSGDDPSLRKVFTDFNAEGRTVKALLRALVLSESFRYRLRGDI